MSKSFAKYPSSNVNSGSTNSLVGILYDKSTFTSGDLSGDFINSGSTVSVVSSRLQFTGGANTFTQTLGLNQRRNTERWIISSVIRVGTINGTSYGFGIGFKSTTVNNPSNIIAKFNMTTGSGTVNMYMGTNSGVGTSSTALTFSVNDDIRLSLERDGELFTARAVNITTGAAEVTLFFRATSTGVLLPNTGRPSIYSFGGTFSVSSFSYEGREPINSQLMIIGDSKLQGYYLSRFDYRLGSLLQRRIPSTIVASGNSETTQEVLDRIQEIIDLAPKQVLLGIGSNDVRIGVPSVTYLANYDSITSQLEAAGIEVVHFLPFYEPSLNQTPLKNHIIATYTKYIDTTDLETNYTNYLYSDLIHPNDLGNAYLEKLAISSGLISGLQPFHIATNNIAGTGFEGDEYSIQVATDARFKFHTYVGVANTIEATDRLGTTPKRFDFRANEYNFLSGAAATLLSIDGNGVFNFPQDGDHKIGSARILHINTTIAGSGEAPSAPWLYGNANTVILPGLSVGHKLVLGYSANAQGWTSALEIANINANYGNLLLMKSGGNVGIGKTPTKTLDINGDIGASNLGGGTYGVTATAVTNVSGVSAIAHYTRINDIVTVNGKLAATPGGPGAVEVGISLPIASSLTGGNQLFGTGTSDSTDASIRVEADATNDRAAVKYTATTGGTIYFTFSYTIQ